MKYNLCENNRMIFTDVHQFNLITFPSKAPIRLHSIFINCITVSGSQQNSVLRHRIQTCVNVYQGNGVI